ncbi:TupA-like ATPgrasp [Devosia enhydra]|uniref:TupA-like ATPgrasp n=1 Tax=Devosia enhydra TaxID=665118 RepID=A0A1K2I424_9HYPH|nr:ATP-grasp fold amidoligase family protein [Devosia enhydra]SFZ86484.1 TupA-like ATPgrasp [Devosia enhydra]
MTLPMRLRHWVRTRLVPALPDPLYDFVLLSHARLSHGMGPRWPNLSNPQRMSDKIIALKRFYRAPDASILADKLAVREVVKERVGAHALVPLLASADRPEAIDLDALPERFVVKPNHASGLILFCDKSRLDWPAAMATMRGWLATDYGVYAREYQYSGITPRLLVEADLGVIYGRVPQVHMIYCFAGMARYFWMDDERPSGRRRSLMDRNWQRQPYTMRYPMPEALPPRPERLEAMFEMADRMAAGQLFARVDVYDAPDRVLFNEITFHHNGGYLPFLPDWGDLAMGRELHLPPLGPGAR